MAYASELNRPLALGKRQEHTLGTNIHPANGRGLV